MSNEGGTSTPTVTDNETGSKKRKGRGKNRFDSNKIAKAKEMGIGFNEFGQAVGDGSIVLSTFCGTLVTQLIPITYKSWPEVPEILKNSVWETTKTKFGLDDIGKDYVLSSMCNCWRQYKSKITKKVRSVPSGPGATRAIQILRPDNIVDDEEWIKFVKFRLSSEFDGINRHYSELAKKNDTPQTTSRKGMARLREELRLAKLEANEDSEEVDRVETWIAGHKHKYGMPSTPAVSINEVDTSSQKGKKCKLLHWIGSGEVVAEAEIECTNPQTLVHHMILGPDHWKIAVKKILVRKVPLCRPTSELHVLEDARGTYIAWPSKYITY
ncbi:hypothetical protein ACOSQ3_010201 [Xanthoceras sorbifolium]